MVLDLLSYGFMQKALLGGIGIALITALLGPFLVLRKLSVLGDGLAHVAFTGVALGLLLGFDPTISMLVITVIAALMIQKIISKTTVAGDAAIVIILSLGLGIGLIALKLGNAINADLFSFLFGSILTLSTMDVWVIGGALVITIIFFLLAYRKMLFYTFNPDLAKLGGVKTALLTNIFSAVTALAVVVSIRAVGILLVSALLVIPALAGLFLGVSFRSTLLIGSLYSIIGVVAGILISFYADLPPGGVIVTLLATVLIVILIIKNRKN